MVGDFGWEHEGTKSGVGTVKYLKKISNLLKLQEYTGVKIQNKSMLQNTSPNF